MVDILNWVSFFMFNFSFIINYRNGEEFDKKLLNIFNDNRVIWDGYRDGFKNIFSVKQISLTNVKEYNRCIDIFKHLRKPPIEPLFSKRKKIATYRALHSISG